jgi:AcrR family transcriptional regulator
VSPAMERQHQDWFARYTDFIEAEANRAAAAGLAPKRDYRLTAIALVGAITGLLREWQTHQPPVPAEDIATEIRAIMIAAITRPITAS